MWQFFDPSALWWLAAGIPAITILYFLKLRRQDEVVSSTLLWKRSVYDLRVNAPIQMIKRNLLLLLQLLILILVILALARPFTRFERAQGRRAALIIDVSASMGTRDEVDGQTRLEAATEHALQLIDELGVAGEGASDEDELAIIAAADRPVVLCGLTSDKKRLRAAVRSITGPKQTRTNMAAALEMAVAVTFVQRNLSELEHTGEIRTSERPPEGEEEYIGLGNENVQLRANAIILSDGAFPEIPPRLADKLAGPALEGNTGVGGGSRFIPFGNAVSDNLAVVAVDVRSDSLNRAARQLFVRVENMGDAEREAMVELELDGEFLDRKRVTLPPRTQLAATTATAGTLPGSAGLTFRLPDNARGVVAVRLSPDDSLPVDNTAYAVLEEAQPIRVLLVTRTDDEFGRGYFIETALDVDRENTEYTVMAASEYPETGTPKPADGEPYELIIFDRFAPAETPTGATFFIDAVPSLPDIQEDAATSPVFQPRVIDWKRAHPMLLNISLLDRLDILKARRLSLSGGWNTLIDGQGLDLRTMEDFLDDAKLQAAKELETPILAALITEDRRVAVLAFNIWETVRWPWRVSFPLFIRNSVHWLARPSGVQRALVYHTGETLRAEYAETVDTVTILAPSGTSHTPSLSGTRQVYFSQTWEPGLYRVRVPDQAERVFAFNLLSSRESDNRTAESITLGTEALEGARSAEKSNVDLWPYLALAALVFLVGEWYVFNRRVLG